MSFADHVVGRKKVARGARGLHHHSFVVHDRAIVVRAHRVTNDGIGPCTGGGARQSRVPRYDRDCFDISATYRTRGAMGGNLAFNACLVTIGATGGIAPVISWRAIDAFQIRWGIGFVMIRAARAIRADGASCAATSDIAHDRHPAARRNRTRRACRAAAVRIATISSAAASTTIGESQFVQPTDDLTPEKVRKYKPG